MNTTMLANNPTFIVAGIFLAFVLIELACSSFRQASSSKRDVLIEVFGSSIMVAITFPLVMWLSGMILNQLLPDKKDVRLSYLAEADLRSCHLATSPKET